MAPTQVSGWAVSQVSGTSNIRINWTAATNAVAYQIAYLLSPGTPTDSNQLALTGNVSTYSMVPPFGTGTYYCYIRGRDSSNVYGPWSVSRTLTYDRTAPPTPVISVPASNPNSAARAVTISWSAVTDPQGNAVTYTLTRGGAAIYTGSATSYTDTPTADGTYTYAVSAADSYANVSGTSSGSSTIRLVQAPVTPAAPTVYAASATSIRVSWSAVANATGYYIYRNGSYLTATAATSYTDAGLPDGSYNYQVAAYGAGGTSPTSGLSSIITIDTTPPVTPTITTAYQQIGTARTVFLQWSTSSGASSYRVERNGIVVQTVSGTSTTDTPSADGTFSYRVYAGDTYGNWSTASATYNVVVKLVPIPVAPSAPTLTQPTGANRSVSLSWPAVAAAATYSVYRGPDAATLTKVSDTASTTFTDVPPVDGTYYYAVQASNSSGSSTNGAASSTRIDRARTGMAGL